MDLAKLKEDEIALLKKAALSLLADEIAEVIPLAVDEANKELPAAFVPEALVLEQQYVPKLQEMLLKLLQAKLGIVPAA